MDGPEDRMMDSLDKKIIGGIAITAAIAASLYAFMSISEGNQGRSPDKEAIERCRGLVREGADILVQIARDGLDAAEPGDAGRLAEFEARISAIEEEMSRYDCRATQLEWAYGSFRQEMSEYESYIADLVRQNNAEQ